MLRVVQEIETAFGWEMSTASPYDRFYHLCVYGNWKVACSVRYCTSIDAMTSDAIELGMVLLTDNFTKPQTMTRDLLQQLINMGSTIPDERFALIQRAVTPWEGEDELDFSSGGMDVSSDRARWFLSPTMREGILAKQYWARCCAVGKVSPFSPPPTRTDISGNPTRGVPLGDRAARSLHPNGPAHRSTNPEMDQRVPEHHV